MLKWLFGGSGSDAARQGEDKVWISDAARLKGIALEAQQLGGGAKSVLVVAWSSAALDRLASELAAFEPVRCVDAFSRPALNLQLQRKGAVALALGSALSAPAQPTPHALEVLVLGRNPTRSPDEAVVRFADGAGNKARVTFHLSFDDALLKGNDRVRRIMELLKMPEDEPMVSSMVSKSIRSLQEHNAQGGAS
jgi:hypothetical protein